MKIKKIKSCSTKYTLKELVSPQAMQYKRKWNNKSFPIFVNYIFTVSVRPMISKPGHFNRHLKWPLSIFENRLALIQGCLTWLNWLIMGAMIPRVKLFMIYYGRAMRHFIKHVHISIKFNVTPVFRPTNLTFWTTYRSHTHYGMQALLAW